VGQTEIIAYFLSVLVGISLGLIGGGGSILTLPILVYFLGINPVLSTAYSLFIVGSTSLVGSYSFIKKGLIHFKTALIFSIPSLFSVFVTRKFIVPAIPEHLFSLGNFDVDKNLAIMLLFAIVMLLASYSMISGSKPEEKKSEGLNFNIPLIATEGSLVGMLTGLVGAGGGFLIIPALVILVRLPMKMAVGTSLLIIAAKSLIGFLGDVGTQKIDWFFLLSFTACSILGILLGSYLNKYISGEKLKKSFGFFVLLMAIYILLKEILFT